MEKYVEASCLSLAQDQSPSVRYNILASYLDASKQYSSRSLNTQSPRYKLPYILASQAQKEVTHNKALEILDVLMHPSVISINTTAPPAEPKLGDCYVIGAEPTGAWANHASALAYYTNGWNFIEAFVGLTVWAQNIKASFTYDGERWLQISVTAKTDGAHIKE